MYSKAHVFEEVFLPKDLYGGVIKIIGLNMNSYSELQISKKILVHEFGNLGRITRMAFAQEISTAAWRCQGITERMAMKPEQMDNSSEARTRGIFGSLHGNALLPGGDEEILIVDDGSTDCTAEIADLNMRENDPYIKKSN